MSTKILGLALAATIGAALPATADFDLPALNAQVQHHQSQLDNHDARITNNEKDIKTLQDNTNTQPAPDPVEVPVVQPTVIVQSVSVPVLENPPVPKPTEKTVVKAWPDVTMSIGDKPAAPSCSYLYSDDSTAQGVPGTCLPIGTVVPIN